MGTWIRLFVVGVCVFNFVACANDEGKKSNSDSAPGAYFPPDAPTGEPLENSLKLARIGCQQDACSYTANIGLVGIRDGNSLGQCTGSLIGTNLVITNSHCIPKEVKNNPKNCSQRLGFALQVDSTIGLPSRVVSMCQELVFASDISDKGEEKSSHPDYAIFRIKDPIQLQQHFGIDRRGFPNETPLFAVTMNPVSETQLSGWLNIKKCVSIQKSMLAAGYTQPFASVISFFGDNCNVISGNSGSPIFREEGSKIRIDVAGVVSHGLNRDAVASLNLNLGIKSIKPLGLGANISCLELNLSQYPVPASCSNISSGATTDSPDYVERYKVTLMENFIKIASQVPGVKLKLKLSEDKTGVESKQYQYAHPELGKYVTTTRVVGTPLCVIPKSAQNAGIVGLSADESSYQFAVPETQLHSFLLLDEYVRMKLELGITTSSRSVAYKITLKKYPEDSKLEVINRGLYSESKSSSLIPWCTADQMKEQLMAE